MSLSLIGQLALLSSTGMAFVGAFSRFTHGRYTPSFYAYQLDRAPDDETTRLVPVVDITVGILLLFPRTRFFAAVGFAAFQSFGLWLRFKSGKPPVWDIVHWLAAVVAAVYTYGAR